MTLIIHIGTGKTGTTSIQASLKLNNVKLNDNDIDYPNTKEGEHNIIEASVLPFEKLHRVFRSKYANNPEKIYDESIEICKRIEKSISNYDNTIISGEYFLTFDNNSITKLLEKIGYRKDKDIKIICYIRRPSSYWRSGLQQRLKGSTTVDDVLEKKYIFRAGLRNWIKVVGKQNIIVRPFDRNQLLNGDVIADFYNQIYLITGKEINNLTLADEKNKSVSAEKCILMQELREELISLDDDTFTDESRELIRLINKCGKNLQQSRMKFHPHISDFIDYHHFEDLNWLKEEFGVELPLPDAPTEENKNSALKIFSQGRVRNILVGYNKKILKQLRKRVVKKFNELK